MDRPDLKMYLDKQIRTVPLVASSRANQQHRAPAIKRAMGGLTPHTFAGRPDPRHSCPAFDASAPRSSRSIRDPFATGILAFLDAIALGHPKTCRSEAKPR
jgi:hypothetical protein